MNLKAKTAAEPRLSRVVHGPSNLTDLGDLQATEENKQQFVQDWATFSQALLWIVQNSRDTRAVQVSLDALRNSVLLNLEFNTKDEESD